MTILTINDLSITKDLDEKAMTAVRGGQANPETSMGWAMPEIPMNLDTMMDTYLGGSTSGTAVSTSLRPMLKPKIRLT